VQPTDMALAGPELEQRLLAHCGEHLAKFKCPKSIDFLDDFPRSATGKLLKRKLRDPYWEGRESAIV
jgi:long-chain acyl-CoA synthetase